MIKKTAFLLSVLMVANLTLFSCAESSDTSDTNKDSGNTSAQNASETNASGSLTETEIPSENIYPKLPDKQFDGYEMKFLVRDESHTIFASKDIYAEEENSEPINDAVYRRNRKIEQQYNIVISQEAVENPGNFIPKLVNSGDCPYDVMIEATTHSVNLSAKNMLTDLNTVPYLDFTQPWWDQSLTKELSIGGKLYCNVSDLIISDKNGTWGVLFNKNLIASYELEDPYSLVKENKWTLDKFFEVSKNVSSDENGDGKFTVSDDIFGFATEYYNIFVMTSGAGCRLADKDENDLPFLSVNNQKFISTYEKAVEITKDRSTIAASEDVPFYGGIIPAFNDGRILFYMGSMALLPLFREMEQDFGILPVPKYDEAQEFYYTTMSVTNNGAIYIPVTNTDLERTGIILEALSAESRYTLLPAYYEVTLKTKLSRDNESAEMIDILFAHRVADIGATYNFGGILDLVWQGNDNFVSGYEKIEARANRAIQSFINSLEG
ncbi:hypothetical protein FACS1894219_06320 [Clostridia bacterium]|nr:hypothetical protein FACS1894219_06320 [Clostridia bacterium]